ncbi:MAG TPA: hypothetical protein VFI57_10560 [Pyrinomonadaceae bacterium]|nr:hypothetical protein [Pyrinomonadaceae bacterium]
MTHRSRSSELWILNGAVLAGICLLLAGISASAQTTRKASAAADDDPVLLDYRGIQIGWLADEVRKKLGAPTDKGDEQDFYVFSEKESCQVVYDKATRKVTAISVDFVSGASGVITPQQVFGSDIESKSDGSKYKLVRYPKAGYWVSYSRTAGETPVITITMQRLQGP